jgi:predicted dehydrogenase
MSEKIKRRDFIKTSLVAAGGVAGLNAENEMLESPAIGPVQGANDQIRLGVIGCGGQGRAVAAQFARLTNVKIVALADVYQGSVERTLATEALKLDASTTRTYKDFRRILDDKNIDAVLIGTPDHWHALPTIMACQAGKDVYVEKPLSLTIEEGRRMVQAARKYNRVVQVGTQQRSTKHFQKAVEIIREGRLGKIARVHTWNHDQEAPDGISAPPDSDPPEGLDWDFYLGPAPQVPFNKNRFLGTFRWFWDYSGGKMTDWGVHLIDIVHWAMNVDAPLSVSAMGGKYVLQDNRETPDTLMVTFEYPGFVLTYENRAFSARGYDGRGYGIMFCGSDGTLVVDRAGFEIIPEYTRREEFYTNRTAPVRMSRGSSDPSLFDHVRNFIECMKSRQRPISDVEIGHRSTSAPHLANIALRSGHKIKWDGQNEKIVGDAEASRWLSKAYRTPWQLVEV